MKFRKNCFLNIYFCLGLFAVSLFCKNIAVADPNSCTADGLIITTCYSPPNIDDQYQIRVEAMHITDQFIPVLIWVLRLSDGRWQRAGGPAYAICNDSGSREFRCSEQAVDLQIDLDHQSSGGSFGEFFARISGGFGGMDFNDLEISCDKLQLP